MFFSFSFSICDENVNVYLKQKKQKKCYKKLEKSEKRVCDVLEIQKGPFTKNGNNNSIGPFEV